MGKKEDDKKDEDDEVKKALDLANKLMHQNRASLAYSMLDKMNDQLDKDAAAAKKKAEEDKKGK